MIKIYPSMIKMVLFVSKKNLSIYQGNQLWIVEKILEKKKQGSKTLYKVKWQGFPDDQNTWEPIENLTYVQPMVDEFEEKNSKKTTTTEKPASNLQTRSKKITKIEKK